MSVALLLTNNLDNSKHSLPRRLLCFCSVHQGSAGRVAGSKLLSTPAYPLFCILQGGIGVFSPHNFFRVPFVSGAYTPRSLRSFSGGIRGRAFTLSSPSHSVPVPNQPSRFRGRKATVKKKKKHRLLIKLDPASK